MNHTWFTLSKTSPLPIHTSETEAEAFDVKMNSIAAVVIAIVVIACSIATIVGNALVVIAFYMEKKLQVSCFINYFSFQCSNLLRFRPWETKTFLEITFYNKKVKKTSKNINRKSWCQFFLYGEKKIIFLQSYNTINYLAKDDNFANLNFLPLNDIIIWLSKENLHVSSMHVVAGDHQSRGLVVKKLHTTQKENNNEGM